MTNQKETLNMKLMYVGRRDLIILKPPIFTKTYTLKKYDVAEMANEHDFIEAIRMEGECIFRRVTDADIEEKKKELEEKKKTGRGILTDIEKKEEESIKNPKLGKQKKIEEPENQDIDKRVMMAKKIYKNKKRGKKI
ncbi:MAG: hypothetical protein ACFFG0_03450 [Candidatus Thorarchaeota archaeon]